MMKFNEKYNLESFSLFLKGFLPEDYIAQEKDLTELGRCKVINQTKELGYSKSLDVYVLQMNHSKETDSRITITKDAFKILATYGIDKALVIFENDESKNYRFSYLTISLDVNDRNKVVRKFSNPRRYSFYLGEDTKIHTPTKFLIEKGKVKNLEDLVSRFDVEVVTEEFYEEIASWYFWANRNVVFPDEAEEEKNGKQVAVIRLITRLIFIWFMKQKSLVPNYFFNKPELSNILNDLSSKESSYYRAILQNLFFATLNTPIEKRKFRQSKSKNYKGINKDFSNQYVYRYHDLFTNSEKIKDYFNNVPFLNGGLFECLDDGKNDIYIDGFTERKKEYQPQVPNYLFFADEREIDLNKEYGTKNKKYKVCGLFQTLNKYNFTIDESTPIDIEISLDPELLGRVFEKLLANYNPETATTARKSTGSYYTPRVIVDYMVDQSLKEYLKTHISSFCHSEQGEESLDNKLDNLFSYSEQGYQFNGNEVDILIKAINELKIIDPAVGSGAFPMGVLQKLVFVLSKIDPHNSKWMQEQIKAIEKNIPDAVLKRKLTERTEDNFRNNELDYGRKLYLIQNCIYGVDIQPIAIQIAKLRFFISLLVDEKSNKNKEENFGIEPLPNLETKFITANSLIGLQGSGQMSFESPRITQLKKELKEVRDKHFNANYKSEKNKLREKDKEIRLQLAELFKQKGFLSGYTKKIADWDPYNSNIVSDWFDPEWMFGIKDGFDIVIGNPPYDVYEGHRRKEIEAINKMLIYEKAKGGKLNAYKIFLAKSVELQRDNGILCEIFQNSFLADNSATKIRKFFLENQRIIKIDSFPERDDINRRVFEGVKMSVCILFSHNISVDNYLFQLRIWRDKFMSSSREVVFNNQDILQFEPQNVPIPSLSTKEYQLLKNLSRAMRLREIAHCFEGEINLTFHKKYLYKKLNGNSLMIKGAAVQKWFIKEKMSQGKIEYLDKENYLKENSGNKSLHHKQKRIVMQGITGVDERFRIKTTILEPNIFCGNSTNYILLSNKNIFFEYVLALLNSSLLNWYFKIFSTNSNVNTYEVNNFPIRKISKDNQKPFINLVDKILVITKDDDYLQNENKKTKVADYETQIDKMVYDLYKLDDDEIKIIEKVNFK